LLNATFRTIKMKRFIPQLFWAGIVIILLLLMFFLPIGEANAQTGNWNTVNTTNSPNARHECSFVQLGDKFYLVGGRDIKPVDQYNPIDSTWTSLNPTPQEFHHFQATEFHGLMYVICAFKGTYPIETGLPFVYIYDPLTDTWVEGMDIPTARLRGSAGVVLRDDKFYVLSGLTNGHQSGWVKWFDEFDPATNIWTTLEDAPNARDHFAAVMAGPDHLVSAGGRRSGDGGGTWDSVVTKTDIYDFTSNSWNTLSSPAGDIPTPRAGTSAAYLDGEVLIIGGETATQWPAHDEVEALDPLTGTWRTLDPLNDGRHGTQAIISNDGIYLCAGSGSRGCCPELNDMEAFYFGPKTSPTGTALSPGGISIVGVPLPITEPGSVSIANITLNHNSGTQAILIRDIRISGDVEFSLSSIVEFPIAIAPGKTHEIPYEFSPGVSGVYNGTVEVDYGAIINTLSIPVAAESQNCDASLAPISLSATALATNFLLTWDEIAGAEKCQVQGRVIGTSSFSQINFNVPPQQINLAYSALNPGVSYEWQVRCACSISPILATPLSNLASFTAPVASPLSKELMADSKLALDQLRVFPNPVNEILNIQGEILAEAQVLELSDILGRVVNTLKLNGSTTQLMDLSNLQAGVYFLFADGKRVQSPVIIE
jgi:hypothetical protein